MPSKVVPYLIFFIVFCLIFNETSGQTAIPPVYLSKDDRAALTNPWAGGMNACQFGQLDIDMDGTKDLVMFDRCGNRIMPFILTNANSQYIYSREYIVNFPELSDWAIFADYNGDGLEDIFTYSPGFAGMKVYRNISGSQLEFTLEVYPYLTSFQGGGYVNILVTYADYPAISDLDGDGDLDILSFWGLGSFVEMHKNMSVEKYGNRDSLDFIKTETCWGYFAESEESNEVTLDTCYGRVQRSARPTEWLQSFGLEFKVQSGVQSLKFRVWGEERHTGSTFQVLDLNEDGLLDLLLGDVDYPNIVALYNGGTQDTAVMTSYDWNFPAYDEPVNLFSMPSAYYGDLDGDNIHDLLVSPFDPNPYLSSNFSSSWFYKNLGTNEEPYFNLLNYRFIQEQMIDAGAGAYPVFHDYDHDGLQDLFIGNYGKYDTSYYDQFLILHTEHTGQIGLYRNAGTDVKPAFTYMTDDFASIGGLKLNGIIPAFGDLDGDGDADMLTGIEDGRIIYFENIADIGQTMSLELRDQNYGGIDVGNSSAPVLFDLDGDDLTDLVIGEKGGNLNYYKNTGSYSTPVFELETDSLGKVNVTDPNVSLDGYSVPFLLRDNLGHVQLIVGSEQGKIFYYNDIEDDLTGTFKESEELGTLIGTSDFMADRGFRTAGALTDLNNDGTFELVAGNFSGGLEYFSSDGHPEVNSINPPPGVDQVILIYPNPAEEFVNIVCTNAEKYRIKSIELYDISGRKVYCNQTINQTINTLSLTSLADGLYFMEITLSEYNLSIQYYYLKKLLKKTKSK